MIKYDIVIIETDNDGLKETLVKGNKKVAIASIILIFIILILSLVRTIQGWVLVLQDLIEALIFGWIEISILTIVTKSLLWGLLT